MKNKTKDRWREICELAATETDSAKLLNLAQEIKHLLAEKIDRLNRKHPSAKS
jgi:hypothetical protein